MIDVNNINETILDLYIATNSDWHEDWANFDMSLLNFTWKTVSYSGNKITFDLVFNSPLTISPHRKFDKLILHVKDPVYFRNKDNIELSTETMEIEVEPLNIILTDNVPMYGDLLFSTVMLGGSLSLVISGGLPLIAGLVNGMQLIIHMPIFLIPFPSNTMAFIENLMPIVLFDVLDYIRKDRQSQNIARLLQETVNIPD